MKYWLIVFLLQPDGEFIMKREIEYPNEATCYMMMDPIAKQYRFKNVTVQMVCVSDDHHSGRKQDPGVPLDWH